jgi:CRP/FNR family transcriptional regulator
MTADKSFLSEIQLFSGLPTRQIEELSGISISRQYRKGEIVFSEGDDGNGFYIVREGRLKVSKISPEGKEKILHIFGPGQPVGEVPVFIGENFPASAEAIENCRLLFFPRDAFARLIERHPSLSMNMLGILSRRLRDFSSQIEQLSLKEVPGRLASYLVDLSREQNKEDIVELNVSKTQLASLLGTIPETLSRIFLKMSEQQLIGVEGKRIRIRNLEGLIALSEQGKHQL